MLIRQTPDHLIEWTANEANNYGGGAGNTFVQILDKVPQFQAEVLAYAEGKFTARTCPTSGPETYDRKCYRYLMEAHGDLLRGLKDTEWPQMGISVPPMGGGQGQPRGGL